MEWKIAVKIACQPLFVVVILLISYHYYLIWYFHTHKSQNLIARKWAQSKRREREKSGYTSYTPNRESSMKLFFKFLILRVVVSSSSLQLFRYWQQQQQQQHPRNVEKLTIDIELELCSILYFFSVASVFSSEPTKSNTIAIFIQSKCVWYRWWNNVKCHIAHTHTDTAQQQEKD